MGRRGGHICKRDRYRSGQPLPAGGRPASGGQRAGAGRGGRHAAPRRAHRHLHQRPSRRPAAGRPLPERQKNQRGFPAAGVARLARDLPGGHERRHHRDAPRGRRQHPLALVRPLSGHGPGHPRRRLQRPLHGQPQLPRPHGQQECQHLPGLTGGGGRLGGGGRDHRPAAPARPRGVPLQARALPHPHHPRGRAATPPRRVELQGCQRPQHRPDVRRQPHLQGAQLRRRGHPAPSLRRLRPQLLRQRAGR